MDSERDDYQRSTKVSPRQDDNMKSEITLPDYPLESRSHEERIGETSEEEGAEIRESADAGREREGMPAEDVEARAQLARYLQPAEYPATAARLMEVARDENATDRIILWLKALPAEREFENLQEVWEALGGQVEERF